MHQQSCCSLICEVKSGKHVEMNVLQQRSCIFPRSLQCYKEFDPAADKEHIFLSDDRGCNIMYDLASLVFECIHSLIDTIDIHPVHKTCHALPEIWFLQKCNHWLEDCLLSFFFFSQVKIINCSWLGNKKCFQCQIHLGAILIRCSVVLCQASYRSIVEDCNSLHSSAGRCEGQHSKISVFSIF